jgi:cysteinyl-tRNA synthetase, unknown class
MSSFGIQLQKVNAADAASSPYDTLFIDNYDSSGKAWTTAQVATMSANKVLGGYVSIGEAEVYRSYWQSSWSTTPPAWLGPENPDWAGNHYIDFRSAEWMTIVKAEIKAMIGQGFEAAYMDAIDVYSTDWFIAKAGSAAAAATAAKTYVETLADYAHSLNPAFKFYVNGAEDLLADKTYLNAIDGVFKEQVYAGIGTNQNRMNTAADVAWTTGLLDLAKAAGKDVFVIHYTTTDAATESVVAKSEAAGYKHYEGPLDLNRIDYTGSASNDLLRDGSGNNQLRGLGGNDTLLAGSGNDTLSGGTGNDRLEGGSGNDRLTGGAGLDLFVLTTTSGKDTVTDFNVADDTFLLASAAFTTLKAGAMPASAFYRGAAAHDADDHIVYDPATGNLIYDTNGNALGGASVIATLTPNLALTEQDFLIL